MAVNEGRKSTKKYWFLKIPDDYFYSKEMKKLRRIAGGAVYSLIYLKMQQIAMKSSGRIYFDGIEETVAAEIALTIDEAPEDVQATLVLLEKMGLAERESSETIYLPESEENTGRETDWARKKREYRAKLAAVGQSKIGQNEDNVLDVSSTCPTDIDIDTDIDTDSDIDREIDAHAHTREGLGFFKNVFLTDDELEELKKAFPDTWEVKINNLSSYMKSTGTEYASHYATIMRWADQDAQRAAKPDGRTEYSAYDYDDLKKWAEKED